MGDANDAKYSIIKNENAQIKTVLDSLNDDTSKNSRLNTYLAEDQAVVLYFNRILLLSYIVIYVFVLLSLYLNRAKTPLISTIAIAVVFFAFPFFIDTISKNIYYEFLNIMQLLYKGNSVYLYKPPTKVDTL